MLTTSARTSAEISLSIVSTIIFVPLISVLPTCIPEILIPAAPIIEPTLPITPGPVSYTHLDVYKRQVLTLPDKPAGKKLIYTGINLPLVAIEDFAELGKTNPLFAKLNEITKKTNGLWNVEAEKYLLANAK